MKAIEERLKALRAEMKKKKLDAWMAPTNDFHGSEYIGEHFKVRKYLTGFTGSVGTVAVTVDGAWLWVDGRYFVQAEKQLAGTSIILCKIGEPGVVPVEEFLKDRLEPGQRLGLDGRVICASEGILLQRMLGEKGIELCTSEDILDAVWQDRPPLSQSQAYFLTAQYVGESRREKLARLRRAMTRQGADVHFLNSLDDIAWLLNMRGNDIFCSPVIQAYCIVTDKEAALFVQEGALNSRQEKELLADGVTVREYSEILRAAEELDGSRLLFDPDKVSFELYSRFPEKLDRMEAPNPTQLMKAVKNPTEQEHIRNAHIKDGVAMTRFLYRMKHLSDGELITEMDAASYLEKLRKEQNGYLGPSFETICAYGENAAMCHYIATEETDRILENRGFFLVDAGGQYTDGTTDVTRTIAMGPLTKEEKEHYTLVLKGMIGLAKARFRHGFTGQQLDYMARGPLWEHGLDYNHGTGHGVGFLLNVHEPPNFIHWRLPEHLRTVFEEGMLTSDEPGYYEAEKHGIRIENLLLCQKENDETQLTPFMHFETVTLCPIDLEAAELWRLDEDERKWLNAYHQQVYEQIGPKLGRAEREWLYEVTRAV